MCGTPNYISPEVTWKYCKRCQSRMNSLAHSFIIWIKQQYLSIFGSTGKCDNRWMLNCKVVAYSYVITCLLLTCVQALVLKALVLLMHVGIHDQCSHQLWCSSCLLFFCYYSLSSYLRKKWPLTDIHVVLRLRIRRAVTCCP
jgi:hypothetical protein